MKPSLVQIPKIIEFLGRNPFEKQIETLGDQIREYRRIHGLTQKQLAAQLGVDQTTLVGWERKEHQPTRRLLNMLISLVTSLPPSVSMLK